MSVSRLFLPVVVLLAPACRNISDPDASAGRAVGGHASIRLAPGVGVAVTSGSTAVSEIAYDGCDDVEHVVPNGASVDLGEEIQIGLDTGVWCGLQVTFAEPVRAAGITQGGVAWSLDLDVFAVTVGNGQPFQLLDEASYTLELGVPGWFRAADLAVEDSGVTSVVVDDAHPAHEALAGSIAQASALLVDFDGDLQVDDNERATGLIARGSERALAE